MLGRSLQIFVDFFLTGQKGKRCRKTVTWIQKWSKSISCQFPSMSLRASGTMHNQIDFRSLNGNQTFLPFQIWVLACLALIIASSADVKVWPRKASMPGVAASALTVFFLYFGEKLHLAAERLLGRFFGPQAAQVTKMGLSQNWKAASSFSRLKLLSKVLFQSLQFKTDLNWVWPRWG